MKIISHRGNINGRDPDEENCPNRVTKAIDAGFDVEVDVWWWNNGLWLGHDEPVFGLPETFLDEIKDYAWLHCKNLEMVQRLMGTDYHWFWHEEDKVTLTSKGYVWCFPGYEVEGGIMVDHGQDIQPGINIAGVCTDHPMSWKDYNG